MSKKQYFADQLIDDETDFEFILIKQSDYVYSQADREDQAIRGRARVTDAFASGTVWYQITITAGDRSGKVFWVSGVWVGSGSDDYLSYGASEIDDGDWYNPDPSDPRVPDAENSQGGEFWDLLDGAVLYLVDEQHLCWPIVPGWES